MRQLSFVLIVGSILFATEALAGETLPSKADQATAECDGVGWPLDYMPKSTAVQLPSISLELREKPVFKETRLTPVDVAALQAEDAATAGSGPARVGIARKLDLSEKDGEWTELPDGGAVWTAAVVLEGAVETRLHFAEMDLPPGAQVYVCSPQDTTRVHGPYTAMGRHERGEFWAGTVQGDTTNIEYYVPAGVARKLSFVIDNGGHMYSGMDGDKDLRSWDDCMIDVPCSPDWPEWRDVSYSVARITFYDAGEGGWFICTGQLLASTNGDLTPYFLTGGHCIDQQSVADTVDFRWFYQHSSCGGSMMTSLYSSDATLLETSGSLSGADWTLLMVEGVLPASVFWSGWTAADPASGEYVVGVHHPNNYDDWKRWSRGRRYYGSYNYHEIHYNIGEGHIYSGSSGSGIWREGSQQLVGNCSFGYGESGCDNPGTWIYYGRFSRYYSTISSYLSGGSDDGFEDNDSCASAATVGDGTHNNLVVKSVDEDWYQIAVGLSEQLNVSLSFEADYGNIDMELYDACGGAVVASSYNTYQDSESLILTNSGPAATFYLRVFLANDTRNQYSMQISGSFLDCNNNSIPDACDLTCDPPCDSEPGCGGSEDCNNNSSPDDCESQADCQPNGVLDICEIANCPPINPACHDCDNNGVPDECDLSAGTSDDCNANSIPDRCDIIRSTSKDCQPNSIPDECDFASGTSVDCNSNLAPDECDISKGTSPDCNLTEIPDECELAANDCNANGTPDECDADCNSNAIPDECDVTAGTSSDCNNNGVADECDGANCYAAWGGFPKNAAPVPFQPGQLMNGLDYIPQPGGDGSAWDNPSETASVEAYGCEATDENDLILNVTVPAGVTPETGYVVSENFQPTINGQLAPAGQIYVFSCRVQFTRSSSPYGEYSPNTDWLFIIEDARSGDEVFQMEFVSSASTRTDGVVPGHLNVKNAPGAPQEYVDTGIELDPWMWTCHEVEIVLDNVQDTAMLYVEGVWEATVQFSAGERRMDRLRVQASLTSGNPSSGLDTRIRVDAMNLCVIGGAAVDPAALDCNDNGVLDECDITVGTSIDCDANGIPDGCLIYGDTNSDGDVDLPDYQQFQGCLGAPGQAMSPACESYLFDADCDGDIDLADFGRFQATFTGGGK